MISSVHSHFTAKTLPPPLSSQKRRKKRHGAKIIFQKALDKDKIRYIMVVSVKKGVRYHVQKLVLFLFCIGDGVLYRTT